MAGVPWTVGGKGLTASIGERTGLSGFKLMSRETDQIAARGAAIGGEQLSLFGEQAQATASTQAKTRITRKAGTSAQAGDYSGSYTAGTHSTAPIYSQSGGQGSLFANSEIQTRAIPSPATAARSEQAAYIQNMRQKGQNISLKEAQARSAGRPVSTTPAPTQPSLPNTGVTPVSKDAYLANAAKSNADARVKAANTPKSGFWGSLGKGIEAHLNDAGKSGFASQTAQNMTLGAGFGALGGIGASMTAAIDPEHFQSNGIVKPMMQGAFKGAMLSAAHAAGSSMTKAQVGDKHAWINRTGNMVQSATQHRVTKGALAMVALADGGNTNFTKPSNPLR